jgi:F-type H+-transporting ATPase subunit epsilon
MRLKVLMPLRVLLEEEVDKVVAEARNGHFCLLPRHADFVAPLVPGILSFQPREQPIQYIGIDEGILVKVANEVLVSTRQATRGATLEELMQWVEDEFLRLDEHERKARSAAAKLEAGLVRRFLDIQEQMRA